MRFPSRSKSKLRPKTKYSLYPLMHDHFMQLALDEAELAYREAEVPIGAVIVRGRPRHRRGAQSAGTTSRSHGACRNDRHHTGRRGFAIVAARRDARFTSRSNLARCAPARSLQARIPVVVYGASDPKAGAVHSLFHLLDDARLNHRCETVPGVLADRCGSNSLPVLPRSTPARKKVIIPEKTGVFSEYAIFA